MTARRPRAPVYKYLQVYSSLRRDIESQRWKRGEQLPSEAQLVSAFNVSRITVTRAVRDLQESGLVERVAGSGTFVKQGRPNLGQTFGLLIADLGETEIFEPICQGMMASPLARDHALIWGSAVVDGATREQHALSLCRQYIDREVSGVFFAPVELSPVKDEINRSILHELDAARIPVVLLDSPVVPYPETSPHDLVGIDNRRAGYVVTEHLAKLGCGRIGFVGLQNSAATVDAREAGYREALYANHVRFGRTSIHRSNPEDGEAVRKWMEVLRPDGIVCANDRTAGRLMRSLRQLEYRIPQDIRLVGIDDVEYAQLLPIPLTTLRQPTHDIGDAALSLMLERIARPNRPPREVRLGSELVVRESCGGN